LAEWVERTTYRKRKMALEGEGRGNIFSPHLVKLLGTKILSKWGGMIWIGSLYYCSSILMFSEWKKLEDLTSRVILTCPSLENLGLEPSRASLRHQTTFFGVKIS
jgi:hypothetical protein